MKHMLPLLTSTIGSSYFPICTAHFIIHEMTTCLPFAAIVPSSNQLKKEKINLFSLLIEIQLDILIRELFNEKRQKYPLLG